MPRLKLIEMDSLNKMIYFRKDDKLIAFDADVAIELISDSLDGKYEPVRHGHWMPYEFATNNRWRKCSVCGTADEYINEYGTEAIRRYCPFCGAKMDEAVAK